MNYIERIFNAFGGVRAAARELNRPVSTLQSWKCRGSMPDEHKPAVLLRASELGLGLTKADFFPDTVGGSPQADR